MKNKIIAALIVAAMAVSVTACGNNGGNEAVNQNTESTANDTENSTEAAALTEAELAEKYPFINYSGKKSSEYELNYDEIIKVLPEYMGLEFELESQYEVNEAAINNYFATVLSQFGADAYKQVTDRDVVEANDYVKLDYTGYKDDVAFDGGAATDVLIDVAGNKQIGATYGFIDGFTSGIPGAKVGETIKCPVTFPEEYSNADLAGQEVVFEFKIKAIYSQEYRTIDDIDDAEVAEVFGEAGFTTRDALNEQLVKDLEYTLQSALSSKISDHFLEDTEVEIPEDYLNARCFEMLNQAKYQYATDTQTLEELVVGSGMVYEDYISALQEAVIEQVKMELILGKIGQVENISISDDEFEQSVTEVLKVNSSMFSSEDDLYAYFGGEDTELGKFTYRNQILLDKVSSFIADNSIAKFESATSEEATEGTTAE